MRKEYIVYEEGLPIKIELVSVKNYPMVWQDSMKILFILKGSIKVTMGNEVYTLNEKEIEIINKEEIYSIRSQEDNLVLILDVVSSFFSRYKDGVENIYYYANSLDGSNQWDSKYEKLRQYISILYYELISDKEDKKDRIEKELVGMMYHLLNNFHSLYYEEESLREDDLQFERFNRIINYLRDNYQEKVSLKKIAEKEYLTPQYLSYKIKDTFGQNFNDFLNQIRIEESRKLLLGTDKSISEIALDIGFSHSRYYNKNFKTTFGLSPADYRKKYHKEKEDLEKEKKYEYKNIYDAENYLKEYLVTYERYGLEHKLVKVDLNLEEEVLEDFKPPSILNLNDASLILEESYRLKLQEIQKEIGYEYGLVNNLFSSDTDVYLGENKFINWTRVELVLESLVELDLVPVVNFKGVDQFIREDFLENFPQYKIIDLNDFKIRDREIDLDIGLSKKERDGLVMSNYMIHNLVFLNKEIIIQPMDEITENINLKNETFFGGKGIITINELKKPAYYTLMFLKKMKGQVIKKIPGFLATKREDNFQILLYNPVDLREKPKLRYISLNIENIQADYHLIKYKLDDENGSIYDMWKSLGKPERLTDEEWEVFNRYVTPKVQVDIVRRQTIYNLSLELKPYSLVVFELVRID